MALITSKISGRRQNTSTTSSKLRGQANYRCKRRQASSYLSILRPRRRLASPSRRIPLATANLIELRRPQSISKTFGKLQCLVGEDRPFRALIKRPEIGIQSTNREECTHGDRPGLFLRQISKKTIEGDFVSDGKKIHVSSVYGTKSASYGDLGACIDHNAQVLLAQKLLSELARGAAKDMKSH